MPDESKDAKAEEWFSKECWLELFGESIREVPDGAVRIMVLMTSLRRMIGRGKSGRKTARRAIQNCVKACIPYTPAQILAEQAQYDTKKRMKKKGSQSGCQ